MNIALKTLRICVSAIACCLLPIACSFAAFDDTGWGARPIAMGGAFTAVGGDTNCMLYNPAGLVTLENLEMNYMYSKLYTGLDTVNLGLNYAAVAVPLKKYGAVGLSWANMASENEYSEDTFSLSYAHNIIEGRLDGGINVKYLTHTYTLDKRTVNDPVFANGSAKGAMSIDIGAMTAVPFICCRTLDVGVALKNVTAPDVGLASKDIVPMEANIGAACHVNEDIVGALDVTYRMQEWGTAEDKLNVHLGGEAWFLGHVLAARAGANMNEAALGFGFSPALFNEWELQLDYSFILPLALKETTGSHRVSLILRFLGPEPGSRRETAEQTIESEKDDAPVTISLPKKTPRENAASAPAAPQQKKPKPRGRIRAVIPQAE